MERRESRNELTRPRGRQKQGLVLGAVGPVQSVEFDTPWGNEPSVLRQAMQDGGHLRSIPVAFACRVAFFQDSTWFAGMWELTM